MAKKKQPVGQLLGRIPSSTRIVTAIDVYDPVENPNGSLVTEERLEEAIKQGPNPVVEFEVSNNMGINSPIQESSAAGFENMSEISFTKDPLAHAGFKGRAVKLRSLTLFRREGDTTNANTNMWLRVLRYDGSGWYVAYQATKYQTHSSYSRQGQRITHDMKHIAGSEFIPVNEPVIICYANSETASAGSFVNFGAKTTPGGYGHNAMYTSQSSLPTSLEADGGWRYMLSIDAVYDAEYLASDLGGGGGDDLTDYVKKTDVDNYISTTSTNPVQNKVIAKELEGKVSKEAFTTYLYVDDSPDAGRTFGSEYQESNAAAYIAKNTSGCGTRIGFALKAGVLKWTDRSGSIHTETLGGGGGGGGSGTADETLSDTSTNPIQNQWLGKRMGATENNSVQIGYGAIAGDMCGFAVDGEYGDTGGQVAVGHGANGSQLGVAVGAGADGQSYGVAIGYCADGTDRGVAIGYSDDPGSSCYITDGSTYGVAVGSDAVGSSYGVAVGYQALGCCGGVAIGYRATGCKNGVSVGAESTGETGGVAVGHKANGHGLGAAIGLSADGCVCGVAVGYGAEGAYNGVAVGRDAAGSYGGVAIGVNSQGHDRRIAIGADAVASGESSEVIGVGATNLADNSLQLTANNKYAGTTFSIRAVSGSHLGGSFLDFFYVDKISGIVTGRRVCADAFFEMLDQHSNATSDVPDVDAGGSGS